MMYEMSLETVQLLLKGTVKFRQVMIFENLLALAL